MADANNRKQQELEIKERALRMQLKSNRLKDEVDKNYAKICKFVTEYPEEVMDQLDWESKEKLYAEADALFDRIHALEDSLRKLDVEYEQLRREVNEFYGREVMQRVDTSELLKDPEETDDADWWKNS